MADQYFASSEGVIIAAGTPATIGNSVILDVASTAGARRINCNEIGVSFNGTSSTATPITVRLVRTSVAPVGGGTITQSPTALDGSNTASSSYTAYMPNTGSPGVYGTTAPTVGATLRTWFVPPTSGLVVQFPLGQEPDGPSTTAAGLGIQVIAPVAVGLNVYMVWTE